MSKFLKEILFFAALACAILGGRAYFGYVPRNSFLSLSGPKHARLKSIPKPRIILTGGSNVLMGMDTGKLEEQFPPYHAVNMSLTFILGPQFTLRDIEGEIQRDDVVNVTLEYESFMNGKYFDQINGVFLLETMEHHPSSVFAWRWPQWKAVISGSALEYAGLVTRESTYHWRNFSKSVRRDRDLYVRNNFNVYGDAIFHIQKQPVANRSFGSLQDTINPAGMSETIELLNDFAERCAAKGARCFLTYPPFPESEHAKHQAVLGKIDAALKKNCKMPILGSPNGMIFSDSMFYDSQYHLMQQGPAIRTQRLAALLAPFLNESATNNPKQGVFR